MALFQKAPKTLEEAERFKPLAIDPPEVLELTEEEWYAQVYRGDDVPQLTWRAVLMGSGLGFLLAFTNLYIGLKTGWALGVAITASILSYSIWSGFLKMGIAKTPMTILETNCMQSTASSAGYATGGIMVSAVSALLMLSATSENPLGEHLDLLVLLSWTLFLGALGTVMAIPMKRNMINRERLKFPTGTAAAVTLQSLYSEGSVAVRKAKALMWAALVGAVVPLLIDLRIMKVPDSDETTALLPADSPAFDWLPGAGTNAATGEAYKPSDWTMVLDHNPVMIAAGALVGLRSAIYMTLSALVLYYGLGPSALADTWTSASGETFAAIKSPGTAWRELGLWLGVSIMVSSGLLAFAMQWKTIVRAFRGQGAGVGEENEMVARTEVPFSWFAWGTLLAGAAVVLLAYQSFDIPPHFGALAVAMTFFLAIVACRATGESDITPIGAMGKIMQLTYGVLIPQNATANLMTAGITSSAAGSAADLLSDLKSGYLLGANPRRQFAAQFLGIFAGTAATVTGFRILVPDATYLLGDPATGRLPEYPAPAAQAWKAVAEVFRDGLENMHPAHLQAIWIGLALGALMVIMETLLPKMRSWLPSATGIGLGLILPFQYPFSMLIGAVAAWVWTRRSPQTSKDYLVPAAAGLIAGVSILGVIVQSLNNMVLN